MTAILNPLHREIIGVPMEDGYPVAEEARPALRIALLAANKPVPWRTSDEEATASQGGAQPDEPAELQGAISEDVGATEFINLLEE